MLQLSSSLLNRQVLSLRTSGPIAKVLSPIINPDNLKIEGFYCEDRFDKKTLVLVSQDIRDLLPQGYVVNDHEVLAEPQDLIRLKPIIEMEYNPINKPVYTVSKQRVGKVSDYAADSGTMFIQKIYISQPLFKSFTGGSLSVDRSQINEITPTKIIINDLLASDRATAGATV